MEPTTIALICVLAFGSIKLTAAGTLAYVYREEAMRWWRSRTIGSTEGGDSSADGEGEGVELLAETKKEA